LQQMAAHAFPGNVRELENLLQRALALSGADVIEAQDLGLGEGAVTKTVLAETVASPPAATPDPSAAPQRPPPLPSDLQAHLDEVERDILLRALERHRYNRTAAGASLGLSLRQMRYRMARLGVIAGDSLVET